LDIVFAGFIIVQFLPVVHKNESKNEIEMKKVEIKKKVVANARRGRI
jgi:energy-converting hydrogenase Eha subunit H